MPKITHDVVEDHVGEKGLRKGCERESVHSLCDENLTQSILLIYLTFTPPWICFQILGPCPKLVSKLVSFKQ